MSCVMKMTMRSSCGSTPNAVLAAPPQAYSPGVPRIWSQRGLEYYLMYLLLALESFSCLIIPSLSVCYVSLHIVWKLQVFC